MIAAGRCFTCSVGVSGPLEAVKRWAVLHAQAGEGAVESAARSLVLEGAAPIMLEVGEHYLRLERVHGLAIDSRPDLRDLTRGA